MAEFDDKLNELLSNPDSMAQIMRLAQSLLKNTSFSISIIASRVGYVNFSHFAKVFKQEFGVSPSEYRKMCDPQGK